MAGFFGQDIRQELKSSVTRITQSLDSLKPSLDNDVRVTQDNTQELKNFQQAAMALSKSIDRLVEALQKK